MDQVADRKHLRKLVEHPLEEQHRDREPAARELPFVEDMRDSAALDFPFYDNLISSNLKTLLKLIEEMGAYRK